jgi:arginase
MVTTNLPAPPLLRSLEMPVGIIALPWNQDRRGQGLGSGPEAILGAGLSNWLEVAGCRVDGPTVIELTEDEQKQYGAWHKVGVHGAHLADAVASLRQRGAFPLALLGDCNGSLGMIAGLQHAGAQRLGMVWFDAHADFNTPETTRSGMLGGMPVAVAAGLCLSRLRERAGIETPLATQQIVLAAVRDTDPLEQELVDQYRLENVPTSDLTGDRHGLHAAMQRLSQECDQIYIHIDLDVLDPIDAPGMNLPVADGPTSDELAAAIDLCLSFEKSAALGIASYNAPQDEQNRTLTGVYRVIAGAVRGLAARGAQAQAE